MPSYDFSVIIAAGKLNHEEILDATDALGNAGCTDALLCGHAEGMELAVHSCVSVAARGNFVSDR